jgi:hypothetical protein
LGFADARVRQEKKCGVDVLAGLLWRRLGLDRLLQRLLAESRVGERHIEGAALIS